MLAKHRCSGELLGHPAVYHHKRVLEDKAQSMLCATLRESNCIHIPRVTGSSLSVGYMGLAWFQTSLGLVIFLLKKKCTDHQYH